MRVFLHGNAQINVLRYSLILRVIASYMRITFFINIYFSRLNIYVRDIRR